MNVSRTRFLLACHADQLLRIYNLAVIGRSLYRPRITPISEDCSSIDAADIIVVVVIVIVVVVVVVTTFGLSHRGQFWILSRALSCDKRNNARGITN